MMSEPDQDQRDDELRGMVLSVALGLCAAVAEKAEQAGLQQAHLVEDVDAAGATWKMRAVYYRETLVVQVTGHVTSPPDENAEIAGRQVGPVIVFTQEQMMRLFGDGEQRPSFQYVVPVPWVKAAHASPAPA